MRPRSPRRMSESRWAPEPTSRWRALACLVRGDLRGIVRARRLSRNTMRNIRQNLFFAFIYNVAGVADCGGGVLYPVVRPFAESDDRERSHDVQLSVGHRERLAIAANRTVTGSRNTPLTC